MTSIVVRAHPAFQHFTYRFFDFYSVLSASYYYVRRLFWLYKRRRAFPRVLVLQNFSMYAY